MGPTFKAKVGFLKRARHTLQVEGSCQPRVGEGTAGFACGDGGRERKRGARSRGLGSHPGFLLGGYFPQGKPLVSKATTEVYLASFPTKQATPMQVTLPTSLGKQQCVPENNIYSRPQWARMGTTQVVHKVPDMWRPQPCCSHPRAPALP